MRAIVNGVIVDPGAGTAVEGHWIAIEDDRVVDVLSDALPSDAAVIDAGGRRLLPGLIDSHIHFLGFATDRPNEDPLADPTLRAIRAAAGARAVLESGITTVRDMGGPVAIAVMQAIEEGSVSGPTVIAAGRHIEPTGGADDRPSVPLDLAHDRLMGIAPRLADGVDGVRYAVRVEVRAGARVIKTCTSGAIHGEHSDPARLEWTDAEITALVDEAHRQGVRVAAHAHSPVSIRQAIEAGADTIEHGVFLDEATAQLMADRGIPLVPTLATGVFTAEDVRHPQWLRDRSAELHATHAEGFAHALRAGVPIAMGSDCAGEPAFPYSAAWRELQAMVSCGMGASAAIAAATRGAADALGLGAEIGQIAKGFKADIIGLHADPLADVSALGEVDFVFHNGRLIRDA